MYTHLLSDPRFFVFLQKCDEDIAALVRAAGCPWCGGVLHSARYPRKPRGALIELGPEYEKRESFCCSSPDCRRRTTPESLRFLDRKVYLGAAVILLAATALQGSRKEMARLREVVGVSVRTLNRWCRWWKRVFVVSPFWKAVSGRFDRPVDTDRLPLSLLERFGGNALEQVVAMLRFLAPVTTSSTRGVLVM